ncbi:MAG: DUF938 domain-containing protein [Polyangiaceae bacterium]
MSTSRALFSAAADRNKTPIVAELDRILPDNGVVLELASGSGQHVVHFASALPRLTFQPSDPSREARESIADYVAGAGLPNLEAPADIDVTIEGWERPVAAIVCINMVHISPIQASEGLFRGAARCLAESQGPLVLYGPYRFHGVFLAESNAAFDASLRARDPRWGVRDVDELDALAGAWFSRVETIALPANNHILVYRLRGRAT